MFNHRDPRLAVVAAIAAVALMGAACGGDDESDQEAPPATPVEASGCSPVTYGGEGRPDFLIAASTVLQGQFVDHGVQISQALKLVLDERDWRAGDYSVGLQLCDETTARSSDDSDPARCRRNARAFSSNSSVLAVAGPWSSTCALEMLPILNRAPSGPLAAVSGSTTYLGLTRSGPGVGRGRAGEVLPDRTPRVRPRGPRRRCPGGSRRNVREARGRAKRVRVGRRPCPTGSESRRRSA